MDISLVSNTRTGNPSNNRYKFSENDRFFYNTFYNNADDYIIRLNTDYTIDTYDTLGVSSVYPIIYKNYLICVNNIAKISIYNLKLTGSTIRDENAKVSGITFTSDYYLGTHSTSVVDEDNNRLILLNSEDGAAQGELGINILDVTNIDTIVDDAVIENLQTIAINMSDGGVCLKNNSSRSSIICYKLSSQEIKQLLSTVDEENIIGVIYKNKHFSYVQPQTLSAGQPDVRAGKTFIGYQGYPETGTMEV